MAKLLFFKSFFALLVTFSAKTCVNQEKKQPNNKLLYKLILILRNNLELEFLSSSSVLLTP